MIDKFHKVRCEPRLGFMLLETDVVGEVGIGSTNDLNTCHGRGCPPVDEADATGDPEASVAESA